MLSQIPVDFTKVKKENLNKVILRAAIIAELDAINLYVQMAAQTDDPDIQKVLLDIAREEKTHVGEFETMLLRFDAEQVHGARARQKRDQRAYRKIAAACASRPAIARLGRTDTAYAPAGTGRSAGPPIPG